MKLKIETMRIAGFRGIRNLEINLPHVAVLIGSNNSGKTSVIKALELALGDYEREIQKEDFYIGPDGKPADKIVVDVLIKGTQGQLPSEWMDRYKLEASQNGISLRTVVTIDDSGVTTNVERFLLTEWLPYNLWDPDTLVNPQMIHLQKEAISLISVGPQRDIHEEFKEGNSFIRRILSHIEYTEKEIAELERKTRDINDLAVSYSPRLQQLKRHLDEMNLSFKHIGHTTLAPFPMKVRDFTKAVSINFGQNAAQLFTMEYHGMGTRSWASLLTVKAFLELLVRHDPLTLPIVAAEEPEAHLHPQAQKTLYKQLLNIPGQVIITTHSPYIAGLADVASLRFMRNTPNGVEVRQLRSDITPEDLNRLQEEIINSRGELLFSNGIVLSEGKTEERALPILFESFSKIPDFENGINFVAVNGSGAKYRPFLILAHDLNIPVYILSDGEEKTLRELKRHYDNVFGEGSFEHSQNIVILDDTDFEGYLLQEGYAGIIEKAITENCAIDIDRWIELNDGHVIGRKKTSLPKCTSCGQPIYADVHGKYDGDEGRIRALQAILDKRKAFFASAIAEVLSTLPKEQFPRKIVELFTKITNNH